MAKAVLVMDMPERCDMCDLRYTLPFGNKVCYIKLKGVTGEKDRIGVRSGSCQRRKSQISD